MSADQKKNSTDETRRQFLKTSTVVAAGTVAGTLAVPRNVHAAGGDEIKIGLVGCGGRGTGAAAQAMNTQAKTGPVKLIAMADAFEDNVEKRYKALSGNYKKQMDVPKERRFHGFDAYKKLMETDCELVILATSPGFRPLHFEAAVNAGKHVFMEKPVGTDSEGIRKVIEANKVAKQKNLLVQVGLQRRHEDRYKETIKRLQDGEIGDINFMRSYWNGGGVWVRGRGDLGKTYSRKLGEMEYQMRNWYYFNWLCGDHIVEQHIHNLDVINWLKAGFPVKASGMGGRQARKGVDHGEIYDHHAVEYHYADGSVMLSQCRHIRGCWNSVSEHAHGSGGYCNIGGASITKKDGTKWSYGRGGGGGHQQEHYDLFADYRAGKRPNEGDYGAYSTMTAIMGRLCTYSGKELTWDQVLNSKVNLGVKDFTSMDDTPPLLPDPDGRYKIAMPGTTRVV
ncbi:MAG: Gfo/Idh/MocA family oxidoreductase [Pirellulales bacterium]